MSVVLKNILMREFAARSAAPAARVGSKVVLIPAGNDTKPHPANDQNAQGGSVFRGDSDA